MPALAPEQKTVIKSNRVTRVASAASRVLAASSATAEQPFLPPARPRLGSPWRPAHSAAPQFKPARGQSKPFLNLATRSFASKSERRGGYNCSRCTAPLLELPVRCARLSPPGRPHATDVGNVRMALAITERLVWHCGGEHTAKL